MLERYFDNAATTPVDPRVLQEMLPFFSEAFGNANSIHEPGRRAMAAVGLARQRVADILGADDPDQIVFTSGATEANNWILQRAENVVCSPFEHSSIRDTNRAIGGSEFANDGYALISSASQSGLAAVMFVNNETGATLTPPLSHRQSLHCDITQAVGKLPVQNLTFDTASFSAHKFNGPKGVGALYFKGSDVPRPLMYGGEHENGLRAGTLNVPGIVGMGVAAAIAMEEANENRRKADMLRALVLDEILKIPDVQLNSPPDASPYIVSLSFLGVEGEALVVEADRAGFSISSGAACSSRSTEPSHVLVALGMAPEWIRGTIRISFGKYNTEAATISLAKELRIAVEKLRTMS